MAKRKGVIIPSHLASYDRTNLFITYCFYYFLLRKISFYDINILQNSLYYFGLSSIRINILVNPVC